MHVYASRLVLILVGMTVPLTVFGAVYKSVGPDGRVTYSDQPQPGATEVELPKFPPATLLPAPATTSTTAPAASVPEDGAQNAAPSFKGYTSLSIVTPANDATVRENTGNVEVMVVTVPEWDSQWGHSIKVLLDGQPLPDRYTSPTFQLKNTDRGMHTLQAVVLDAKQGELITSSTVTFHMKRHSAQFIKAGPLMAPNFNPPAYLVPSAP